MVKTRSNGKSRRRSRTRKMRGGGVRASPELLAAVKKGTNEESARVAEEKRISNAEAARVAEEKRISNAAKAEEKRISNAKNAAILQEESQVKENVIQYKDNIVNALSEYNVREDIINNINTLANVANKCLNPPPPSYANPYASYGRNFAYWQ